MRNASRASTFICDSATRRQRYADAMAQAYAPEPDDPDVASFYALALLDGALFEFRIIRFSKFWYRLRGCC